MYGSDCRRGESHPKVAAGLVPARRVPRGMASPSDAWGHKGPGYIRNTLTAHLDASRLKPIYETIAA